MLPLKDEKGSAADLRVTRVFLGLGRYRFEDQFRDPKARQAVSFLNPSDNNSDSASWRNIGFDFDVGAAPAPESVEIDLVCELRAAKGEVWFDLDSPQLRKKQSP